MLEPFVDKDKIKLKHEAPYIYTSPFLSQEFCDLILANLKFLNKWEPDEEDADYFTQDIHIDDHFPDIFNVIAQGMYHLLYPDLEKLYWCELQEVHAMFAIRYTLDTQKSLKLHRDDSFVSASIKLNSDYEGADLVFPEENFTNANQNVGDIMLWPATITHPHKSEELISGEKYSLTIWTYYPKVEGES